MQQRQLGPDGPLVGAIGLGGMPMSVRRERPSEADSINVLLRAAELGMTLWDTADAYCLDDTEAGHNERLLGRAYARLPADLRPQVVLATKGGQTRPRGEWAANGRPEHIRQAVDASLQALGVGQIDLYQFHRPDPGVPFAETMGAFAELRQQGKVRAVGLSNVSPAQIDEALALLPVASVQNQFSPLHREPERDGTLDKCRERGLAFLPWSPLGGLGGAKGIGREGPLAEVAGQLGVSPQRVVLAWLLGKYERLIPIPGVSRVESVEDSARGGDVALTAEQAAQLDAAFV